MFGLYSNELLVRLEKSGLCCHIGNTFLGALAFAHDLVLLSPSMCALRKLLDICVNFAKEFNVVFNPKKNLDVIFSNSTVRFIIFGR